MAVVVAMPLGVGESLLADSLLIVVAGAAVAKGIVSKTVMSSVSAIVSPERTTLTVTELRESCC